ncbi:MAG: DUF2683 family protein [Patescibacteria group bacterium]|nr:hypothetical protein [Patescibacteria group bacterium]MBU1160517.1 hypothetical protein [Patescibacteria group bacterium]MBU1349966.1 hypothetical protein [Patescibacteria group bacterium]MBU1421017.1 hypothetical protein [Patescibacteria group bacterium]MBU1684548.1 hypothetical protein [Patescibacteria group bacterium]
MNSTQQINAQNYNMTLPLLQVKKLFDLSIYLTDFCEKWMESQGLYNNDFIQGIKQSDEDLKKGRFKEVNSLNEL